MNVGHKPKNMEKFFKVQKLVKEEGIELKNALIRFGLAKSTYHRIRAEHESKQSEQNETA